MLGTVSFSPTLAAPRWHRLAGRRSYRVSEEKEGDSDLLVWPLPTPAPPSSGSGGSSFPPGKIGQEAVKRAPSLDDDNPLGKQQPSL